MASAFTTHEEVKLGVSMVNVFTALQALRWDVLMAKEFTMGQAVK